MLERHPLVDEIHYEPFSIPYEDEADGRIRHYVPDILVNIGGAKEVWEIKPQAMLGSVTIRLRFAHSRLMQRNTDTISIL